MALIIFIILCVLMLAAYFVWKRHDDEDPPAVPYTPKQQIRYTLVYPYGFWSKCWYVSDMSFNDGDLVIVDIKGDKYPGRIVEITYTRPKELPPDVNLKRVERHLKASDKHWMKYWSEQLDGFFRQ